MQLKIWGCRGSVPSPGPTTVVCGGNTSCVELSLDDGTVLVLDAGTGIRDLGDDLVERGVRRIHLLLTHLHLDHVEGLRFFGPMWDKNVTLDVWGPPSTVREPRGLDRADVLAAALPDRSRRRARAGGVPRRAAAAVEGGERARHGGAGRPSRPDSGLPDRGRRIVHRVPARPRAGPDGHRGAAVGLDLRSLDRRGRRRAAPRCAVLRGRVRAADRLGPLERLRHDRVRRRRSGWGDSCSSTTSRTIPTRSSSGLEDRAQELVRQDGGRPTLAREGMVVELS